MSRRSDQRYLVDVAYADDAGFNARLSLYKHQDPRIDLVSEVIASLGELDGRRVVDVGCGNGQYLGSLCGRGATVIGVDLSPGMLANARDSGVSLAAADASALPIASGLIEA